jgi:uncharacterized RDD family membrane protein YckC
MEIENNVQQQQQDLFADTDIFQYQDASTGQRFLNFLIDNLLMRFGLSYLTGTVVGMFLGVVAPDFIEKISLNPESFDLILLAVLIGYFNYIVYYTFCEKVFRGYTLGKLITGTRAIRQDGQELTFKDALLRSLSRIVPFEPFSGFGYPWHDQWTQTMVIKSR